MSAFKVGDRVRITREVTVAGTTLGGHRTIRAHSGKGYFADDATIELLDRPVDLPRLRGSLVKVSNPPHVETWLLTQVDAFSIAEWVSSRGNRLTEAGFKQYLLGRDDRTFEVIT